MVVVVSGDLNGLFGFYRDYWRLIRVNQGKSGRTGEAQDIDEIKGELSNLPDCRLLGI